MNKTESLAGVRIDPETLSCLEREATKRGTSVAEVVRSMLRSQLAVLGYFDPEATARAELRARADARARARRKRAATRGGGT